MLNSMLHSKSKVSSGLKLFNPYQYFYQQPNIVSESDHDQFKIVTVVTPQRPLFSIFGFSFGNIPEKTQIVLQKCTQIRFHYDYYIHTVYPENHETWSWITVASWNPSDDFNECLSTALAYHANKEQMKIWFDKLKVQ